MRIRIRKLIRAWKLPVAGVLVLAVLIYWPQQRLAPAVCQGEIARLSPWNDALNHWIRWRSAHDLRLVSRKGGRAIEIWTNTGPHVTVRANDIDVDGAHLAFPPASDANSAIARVLDDQWRQRLRLNVNTEGAAFVLIIEGDVKWSEIVAVLDAVGSIGSRRAAFVFSRPFPALPSRRLSPLDTLYSYYLIRPYGHCHWPYLSQLPYLERLPEWRFKYGLFPECSQWRIAAEATAPLCFDYDPFGDAIQVIRDRETACGCAGGLDLVDDILSRRTTSIQPKVDIYADDQIALISPDDDARPITYPAEASWGDVASDFMSAVERQKGRPLRPMSK